ITFIVLVVTGVSQKFHDSAWAEWIIMNLGGIDNARIIHRTTGLVFTALTLQHILTGSYGLIVKKWMPSMVINLKDFTDAIDNLKYYFGITDMPARCDRYDYKQKFEYWGVVVGGVLMIMTGLTLWFPTKVFHLIPFLPGQIIPAAKAAHTNEAMLALLVIVIWHIYNSVFSPEVFPLDTAIFTGRISKERMIHEHPLEYERLTGEKLRDDAGSEEGKGPEGDEAGSAP
ncbi:MAG: cytochrome b/b6 domain-containing protein, partial [Nitrospiraceae bacterium]|nr:cytochrome b/b6 domain-containing protein [Nitrospiraceae bacterium]